MFHAGTQVLRKVININGVTGKVSGVWGEWGMTPVGRPWDAHRTPNLHTHLVPPVLEKSRPHSKFTALLRCKTPMKLSQLALQGLTTPFVCVC